MDKKTTQALFKAILAVTLVIAIGALSGLAYYLRVIKEKEIKSRENRITGFLKPRKEPDETASWKTYRNARLGFAFKYPQEWERAEEPDIPAIQVAFQNKNNSESGMGVGRATESDMDNFNKMVSGIESTKEGKDADSDISKSIKEYNAEIATFGSTTTVVTTDKQNRREFYVALLDFQDEAFLVVCSSDNGECKSKLGPIISSFKYIQKSERPFLGVVIVDVARLAAEQKISAGLPEDLDYGTLIVGEEIGAKMNILASPEYPDGVIPDSPADKAGLKSGDVILEIDGEKVTNSDLAFSEFEVGDAASVTILREGREMEKRLKFGAESDFKT